MRVLPAAVLMLALAGCGGPPPPEVAPTPPADRRTSETAALRAAAAARPAAAYGDSCTPRIARARQRPDDPALLRPIPADTTGLLPPKPPPALRTAVLNLRLDLAVDSVGAVTVLDVAPRVGAEYTRQLEQHYGQLRLLPALLEGCGVPTQTQFFVSWRP